MMKSPYVVAGMILCGLVSCSEHDGKKQQEHINNNQENYVHLKCDPNCTFEQRLEQQYHLNANDYLDKNDSPWVIEQKKKFILDSLPKDYNFDTNPAKGMDFGGTVKNGLSFESTGYQLSNQYLYLTSFTRHSYSIHGDFTFWQKNLLLDKKNQKILTIYDMLKDESSKQRILAVLEQSDMGKYLKSQFNYKNPNEGKAEYEKTLLNIYENNWSIEPRTNISSSPSTNTNKLQLKFSYHTGGNYSYPEVPYAVVLTDEQAKQLIKSEFLN